jgi:dsRNA-specific ribonuclease
VNDEIADAIEALIAAIVLKDGNSNEVIEKLQLAQGNATVIRMSKEEE